MKKLMSRLAFFISVCVFAVSSVFISGCSSSQPQKTYYQLPALTSTSQESRSGVKDERQLWVKGVTLADYLASPGIVYQTGDVIYVNASNHLWASPLEQQLKQVLITELSAAFPQRLIAGQPLEKNADTLDITITAFHGRYDGKVMIQGYWMLFNQGGVIKQPFKLELEQKIDGYAELVRTLATGYSQLAQSIASQIATSV
ncbi:conserved hypothetical protein; putative exported protein [Xenorhabdus bovienii str. Jollieti]|uniref:ABC-type transport auxiliary lipoprotein component domain-containing protein n=1 Tax=Xenorhabdus bovienii (strain SS-2004) TaxID=406818 RepID=D3UWT9_XENBS|nr:membrane integrity-associated transporter subunit PqiC [Xenorhabdus bovienii]CBJ79924.1 conserved hypothetical protein; putative exported protein [Xenorhabdus bovienii SS-2004]CDH29626.1 conserved hypothetical protein; putative exported protein [Xenorhabdus bovienii str. Jollieti]